MTKPESSVRVMPWILDEKAKTLGTKVFVRDAATQATYRELAERIEPHLQFPCDPAGRREGRQDRGDAAELRRVLLRAVRHRQGRRGDGPDQRARQAGPAGSLPQQQRRLDRVDRRAAPAACRGGLSRDPQGRDARRARRARALGLQARIQVRRLRRAVRRRARVSRHRDRVV